MLPQALHKARVLAETDFQLICEENALRDKLYALETLCEEQGIVDGDAPTGCRWAGLLLAAPARPAYGCAYMQRCRHRCQVVHASPAPDCFSSIALWCSLQRCPAPSRAPAFWEAQQQELEELQEMLAQVGLA